MQVGLPETRWSLIVRENPFLCEAKDAPMVYDSTTRVLYVPDIYRFLWCHETELKDLTFEQRVKFSCDYAIAKINKIIDNNMSIKQMFNEHSALDTLIFLP